MPAGSFFKQEFDIMSRVLSREEASDERSRRQAGNMKNIWQDNKGKTGTPFFADAAAFSSGARWLFLGLIILFVVAVRVRLLDVPLERDEGEYAYMGQLLLQGIPPYSEAYNMKFPGTYLMYAGIMAAFGQSIQGIHLGFMLLNGATILLLFFLSRKIVNDSAAIMASCTYAVLSLSPSVYGFAAHATHFVALPAIGGALLLHGALERNRPHWYFLSGAVFGLATIMKQPGLVFTGFGVSCVLYHYFASKPTRSIKRTIRDLALFLAGSLMPYLAAVIWLYTAGVFDKFWFWTVKYAARYGSQVPLSRAFDVFQDNFPSVVDGFILLWIISAAGFMVTFFRRDLKAARAFIIFFAIFSFLSVCPGFYFRPHYFITLLPAISLLSGIFIDYLNTKSGAFFRAPYLRFTGTGIFIAALLTGIASQKEYFFSEAPAAISRKIYGANPFPESIPLSKFIEDRSNRDDRIAVFGSEPQIYFYSHRRSATGYIYTYSLMEHHDYALSMQKEMIREVESAQPKFVIVVSMDTSWLVQPDSEKYILGWLDDYIREKYRLVGVADIISPELTVYRWDADARRYAVQSQYHVLVFEKV